MWPCRERISVREKALRHRAALQNLGLARVSNPKSSSPADPRARWMKSRNSCARRYHSRWKSQAASAPNLDELSARPAQLRERRTHSAAALQREEPNPQRTTSLLPASAEYIDWYRRICLGERLKSNSTYRGITAPAVSGRRQCLHRRSASYCVRRISIKGFSTACLLTLSACL